MGRDQIGFYMAAQWDQTESTLSSFRKMCDERRRALQEQVGVRHMVAMIAIGVSTIVHPLALFNVPNVSEVKEIIRGMDLIKLNIDSYLQDEVNV